VEIRDELDPRPDEPLEETLLAAADEERRPLPVRYASEDVEVELIEGLGGLPAAVMRAGPSNTILVINEVETPLALGRQALLPWLEEAPDALEVRVDGLSLRLLPV
jgi:hypothetical protein